jgi:hypothetical protein
LVRNKAGQDRDEDVISIASTASHSSSSYSVDEQLETSDVATTPIVPLSKDSSKPIPKARKRWLSRLPLRFASSNPFSEGTVIKESRRKSLEEPQRSDKSEPLLTIKRHSFDASNTQTLQPPGVLVSPTKTTLNSEGSSLDKGVYDSSNKQRVPSW